MGMKRILMIVVLIGLGSAPLAGRAEEELFDTKAAVQHLEQGIAHLNAKHYDAAIAEFEESAAISPEAEAYYYLGYAYYLKGRTKDGENRNLSRENFEKAYEIDPNFTPRHATPAEAAGMPSAAEQPVPSSPASAPAATNAVAPAAPPAQPAP
jgi:tetratricopeptide (TPR) repeat protein